MILEDSAVVALARNTVLTSVFPFLKAALGGGGCACKGAPRPDFNAVKANIAALSSEGRSQLKQLAGIDSVTIYYKDAAGNVTQVTF